MHVCAWEIMYTAHDGISRSGKQDSTRPCALATSAAAADGAQFNSSARREINASHMQILEQLMCFWAVASAAIGWLDLPKLRDGSEEVRGRLYRFTHAESLYACIASRITSRIASRLLCQLDKIDAQIKKRRARLDAQPALLYDEVMNVNAALVDGGRTFSTWTQHVLNSFSTAEGRSSMMDSVPPL